MSSQPPKRSKGIEVPTDLVSQREDIQSQVERLLLEEASRRVEILLASPKAKELVGAMPDEDFFMTVKEVGPEDVIPLLQLASPVQWQHLLDLELWRKDRVFLPQVERWLRILLSCGWDCVHRWLLSVDPDLLVTILKKEIRVFVREDDTPTATKDMEPVWTLDDVYYVDFRNAAFKEIIQGILRILAEEELNLYRRVMEHIIWRIDSEVEEQAYHFRSARLEDHGIFPLEESISVYQYQPKERLEAYRRCDISELSARIPGETRAPHLPWKLAYGNDLIGEALRLMSHSAQVERVKMELASLGNQVLIADLKEIEGKETLVEALDKIKSYLTIGLQRLGTRDAHEAVFWLSRLPLRMIFRFGFSALLERSWRANHIWRERWSSPFRFRRPMLGFPWGEILEGLEDKRPMMFEPKNGEYRDPRSLDEVEQLDRELDFMEVAGALLQEVIGSPDNRAFRRILKAAQPLKAETISWRHILLTSFASWVLRGSTTFSPLSMQDVRRFHDDAWHRVRPRKLRRNLRKGWARRLCVILPDKATIVESLADDLLDCLEEALGRVSTSDLDPRFLPFIVQGNS